MKSKLIFLLLTLISTVAFAQTKVSTLPALPAYNATYTYGITNSGTDGKVPINAIGGLAVYNGSTPASLLPYLNDTALIGTTSLRFSGIYLKSTGYLYFTNGTRINAFTYVDSVGPLFHDDGPKNVQFDFTAIPNSSSMLYQFPNNSGVIALAPQVSSKSAPYTLALTDANNEILHPSADTSARTFTIPPNSGVAFPVGTKITFINQHGAGTVTIAIKTDTMRIMGAGTTGSRTLTADGIAFAIKITNTEWVIYGTNLT